MGKIVLDTRGGKSARSTLNTPRQGGFLTAADLPSDAALAVVHAQLTLLVSGVVWVGA